ncbi:MAG: glycosyltransferase [Ardenticatenia bacterium]|nr:MAG: glycosyltransferase [Ardenticatenia bacterium]
MHEWGAFLLSWYGQQAGILAYLLLILANTIANALTLRRLETASPPKSLPSVAVLVPARNEAATIERCVRSLLAQTYPDAHIYVLDDNSTDATPEILQNLAHGTERLTVLRGQPLPPGWLGKPWACWQLAHATTADVLVFIDADTWHAPTMLSHLVAALIESQAHLLSVFPRQETRTLAEKLSVPLIPWSLLTHFPLAVAQRFHFPIGAAAIGQVLTMPRAAYERVGGHAVVRQEVAEDMALARHVDRLGLRWALWDGTAVASCRMYRSARDVWEGFGKNLFAAFGRRLSVYLFIWLWLTLVFIGPWGMLAAAWIFHAPLSTTIALTSILIAALLWLITARRLRLHPSVVWLFPLIHITSTLIAFHSLGQAMTRRATWKNRPVYPQPSPAEKTSHDA